jgi:large repetitive protein
MFRLLATIVAAIARRTTRPVRRPRVPRARLGVEELTPRVLPNANMFGLGAGSLACHAAVSTASTAQTAATHSGMASKGGASCGAEATLSATLTNASGDTGQATFNATTGTLFAQVKGAAANSSLTVAVDGTTVGTLTTNASGNGQVKLSNVSAQAGDTVTVGDLSGTLAQVRLTASLTGSSGATGSADFNSLKNQLHLSVQGAAASTTYNVTVNDVVVGQITTNSAGAGKLHVSPIGVTIQAGSTVAVSDTAGNPAILQGTFA